MASAAAAVTETQPQAEDLTPPLDKGGPCVLAADDSDQRLVTDLLQIKNLFANHHLSDVLFVFSSDSTATSVPSDSLAANAAGSDREEDGKPATDAEQDSVAPAHHLIPAHRLVLALRSGALHAALLRSKSSHVPSQVRFPLKIYIQDTPYPIFFALLRFLYTNQVVVDVAGAINADEQAKQRELEEFWKQLLRAAFIYCVPSLVDICVERLVTLLGLPDPTASDEEAVVVDDKDASQQPAMEQLRKMFELVIFCDKMLAMHPSARRRTSKWHTGAPGNSSASGAAVPPPPQSQDTAADARGQSQCIYAVAQLQRVCMLQLKSVPDRRFEVLLHTDVGKQCSTERICELLMQRSDTPLVVAVRYQLARVVNELLRLGEPLDSVKNDEVDLPLVAALKTGNDAIIRRLLVDENAPFFFLTDKIPLFLLACSSGNVMQCEILIERNNADVNLISELQDADKDIVAEFGRQQTPLHIASRKGHSAVVELLLKHNAASNLPDADGNTALHCAANLETVEVLLSTAFKTNANIPNRRGRTPLHLAAARGEVNIVDFLLHHGAQQDILDDQGQNAFHHAAANGHTAVTLILLHENEPLKTPPGVAKAINEGNGSAVADENSGDSGTDSQDDLGHGFDINMADLKGNTALHLAAMSPSDRCQKMLQLLLENGADPNRANWFGYSPVHLFCAHQSGPASVIDVFVSSSFVFVGRARAC